MVIRKSWGIFFLFICLSVSLFCVPASAAGEPTIQVSSKNAQVGDIVDLTISLANNPGITGMRLNVNYNSSALSLVNVIDAGVLGENVHNPDKTLCPYILCWTNDTIATNYMTNDVIATLTFQVKKDTALGTYPVEITYDNQEDHIINAALETVDFTVRNGSITVVPTESTNENSGKLNDTVTWIYHRATKTLDIQGTFPTNQSVFVGSYDKDGKLLNLAVLKTNALGLKPEESAWRLKLFMLGEAMNPQCDSIEILTK